MLAALVVRNDRGRADLVEAVDEHRGRAAQTRRQMHLAMEIGDVDEAFDAMLQEGLHEAGHAVGAAAGIGDEQRAAVLGEHALDALDDVDVGEADRLAWIGRHRDRARDHADEPRLLRAHGARRVGWHVVEVDHGGFDRFARLRVDGGVAIEDAADGFRRDASFAGDVVDSCHCFLRNPHRRQ